MPVASINSQIFSPGPIPFVIGHHSMYTGGKRINDIPYARKHLEKLFIKHNVDAYLCGHEHDLQYIKPNCRTTYLVSGAGSEITPTGNLPDTRFAAAVNGFHGTLPDGRWAICGCAKYGRQSDLSF
jgi:hypothetical protein